MDGIPQIAVVLKGPQKHCQAMRRVARPYKDEDADVIAHFRLDDDDAVAVDFIERSKAAFVRCQAAYDSYGRCALDFNQGYKLMIGDGRCTAQRMEMKTITTGLVIYIPPIEPQTIMNYPHHRIHEYMPIVTDVTPDMFVRSYNTFNDSPKARGRTVPNTRIQKEDVTTLAKRFKISIPDILKALEI